MKSLWIVLVVLCSNLTFGQVDEFERHMDLFERHMDLFMLNQSDVEDRLGYSCNLCFIYSMGPSDLKNDRVGSVFVERYLRLARKKDVLRLDVHFGRASQEGTPIVLQESSYQSDRRSLRASPALRWTINSPETTEIKESEKRVISPCDWLHSPFELHYYFPLVYGNTNRFPVPKYVACIKSEDKGCVVWTCLASSRKAVSIFTFDKDVEFLPRTMVIKSAKDITKPPTVAAKDFNGNEDTWVQTCVCKIEWEKIKSQDVFVPSKVVSNHSGKSEASMMTAYFKNWKVGEEMDKKLLDENEFKKIDVKKFAYQDLIKVFPEHPPVVEKN